MDLKLYPNTPDDELFANVRENCKHQIPWVELEPEHDGVAVIVGGGPSLKTTWDEVKLRSDAGQTVFALNNAARFLFYKGIKPRYSVILDAKPDNWRFLGFAKEHLIASQCHPGLFRLGPARLWHPAIEGITEHLPKDRQSTLVGASISVGLSALCLAYTMGYRTLHLYGYDSSHDGTTHAYEQERDPRNPLCTAEAGGKIFATDAVMARQAEMFPDLAYLLADEGCEIHVHGTGFLPTIAHEMTQPEKIELYVQETAA
jgi:hypothetical protein